VAAQALAVLRNDHPPDSALWRASNAAAVELNGVRPEGGRTADLLFVSWLLPWKGGSWRFGRCATWGHREAVLRSYSEGPDGPRLERAARRWGVADRVRSNAGSTRRAAARDRPRGGARPPLLPRRRAAVLRRSAEPGDARGLPGQRRAGRLVRRWSASPVRLVASASAKATARRLSEVIDGFLAIPPPVRSRSVPSDSSFADAVLDAYERAARRAHRGR
jgi:hypothetical protein